MTRCRGGRTWSHTWTNVGNGECTPLMGRQQNGSCHFKAVPVAPPAAKPTMHSSKKMVPAGIEPATACV